MEGSTTCDYTFRLCVTVSGFCCEAWLFTFFPLFLIISRLWFISIIIWCVWLDSCWDFWSVWSEFSSRVPPSPCSFHNWEFCWICDCLILTPRLYYRVLSWLGFGVLYFVFWDIAKELSIKAFKFSSVSRVLHLGLTLPHSHTWHILLQSHL